MNRRHWVALAAIAATAFTTSCRLRPGQRDQDCPSTVQDRTAGSLWQADDCGLHDGPGLCHRRHHDVAGRKLVVIEKDDQGKPDVGKAAAGCRLCRRQGRHRGRPDGVRQWAWPCCPWPKNTKRSCWSSPPWPTPSPATSGTNTSSALAAIQSQDAAANAAALDNPATWWLATWPTTTPLVATASRRPRSSPRTPRSCTRNTCQWAPMTSPLACSASLTSSRTSPATNTCRWAGRCSPTPFPKIADLDLEKRYGIKLATGGNILPAMVAYKQLPGHGRRALLLLWHPQEPDQRRHGGPATTPSSSRRQTSSRPVASRLPWPWSRRSRRPTGTPTPKADFHHGRHEL
jgi:branched-chain amino acid transport system substrate-binding protein